uniref:Uncharacterized protein n=1 Tax=Eiseniibacteriota bacterium TaxID=2212470 RepID=A0A832I0S5_UNCEI
MMSSRGLRRALAATALLASGCTTLREIPPAQYTARAQRENVRIVTRDGLVYDFEWVEVRGDTLRGYRRRDLEGRFEEVASLDVAVSDVARLSRRTIDWARTGLIGGGVIAAALLAGVGSAPAEPERNPSSGGGSGRPPQ